MHGGVKNGADMDMKGILRTKLVTFLRGFFSESGNVIGPEGFGTDTILQKGLDGFFFIATGIVVNVTHQTSSIVVEEETGGDKGVVFLSFHHKVEEETDGVGGAGPNVELIENKVEFGTVVNEEGEKILERNIFF
jgi:hypothetical protein